MASSLDMAVSGMRAQQDKMSVIGNNIANSKTIAYKAQKMTFIESFVSQGGQFINGIRNQYGNGVKINGITSDWESGATESTNIPSHVAISGEGFFPIRYNETTYYTRAGDFSMVASEDTPGDFIFMRANGAVLLGGSSYNSDGLIDGSLGVVTFRDMSGNGEAPTSYEISPTGEITALPEYTWQDEPTTAYGGIIFANIADAADYATWSAAYQAAKDPGGTNPVYEPGYLAGPPFALRTWDPSADYEAGYTDANIPPASTGFKEASEGNLVKGIKMINGNIGLQQFNNPDSLERTEAGMYLKTSMTSDTTSAPAQPGQNGSGKLVQGALESSNVDLVSEFTDMIVTQRAFQANSKTITTSDEMLQTVLSLKR